MKKNKTKGGVGSGRRPGSTAPRSGSTPIRTPAHVQNRPTANRSGVSPSQAFPYGRNSDGTPKPKP